MNRFLTWVSIIIAFLLFCTAVVLFCWYLFKNKSTPTNLYTLVDILPDYVKAIATMAVLPTSIKTNILYVQVITITIIMAIVIFLGI